MPTKKKVKKSKKSSDVDIKISNLDKIIKADKKNKKYCKTKSCGHFWIFGSALAMILSYTQNSSILWAILHGIFSWFYVLYRAMIIWGWF